MIKPFFTFCLLIFFNHFLFADTLTVNQYGIGTWSTIQEAIDYSSDGDIILLADGVFKGIGNRDLNTLGKSITISSESSIAENCIIDCEGTYNVNTRKGFIITSGEDTSTVIKNISIINGATMMACPGCEGAAVYIEESSALFENVIFRNNHGSHSVFHASYSDNLVIRNCKFFLNKATMNTCIDSHGYNVLIEKCLFFDNIGTGNGGIISVGRKAKIINNTITNNDLGNSWLSSVFKYSAGFTNPLPEWSATIENTLITNNNTLNIFHHYDSCFPMPEFKYCNHFNNNGADWSGYISNQFGISENFSKDPLYIDTLNNDYRITEESPCIDAGNPNSPNDPDGTIADIGCYFFNQHSSISDLLYIGRDEIAIFPNPSKGKIQISICDRQNIIFDLIILNSSGETVKQIRNLCNYNPIDLGDLPNGVYLCFLKIENYIYSHKIVLIK